jgi:flagellar basal-body rod protein FlgB
MAISFDKALGSFPEHLKLYAERSSVLASNIANADTPGFKARDMDFRAMLASAGNQQLALTTTRGQHIGGDVQSTMGRDLQYRYPLQPSLDGNTVDLQVEQSEFAQNAVRYQSTLRFLSGRFSGLMLAIKGGS